MNTEKFANIIRARVKEKKTSAARVSKIATGKDDAVARVYRGHEPGLHRVSSICDALGLELKIEPKNPGGENAESLSQNRFDSRLPAVGQPGLEPVSDRALAELITNLIDDWEAGNEHARQKLIAALTPHIHPPSGGGGGRRARLESWLRGSAGGSSSRQPAAKGNRG